MKAQLEVDVVASLAQADWQPRSLELRYHARTAWHLVARRCRMTEAWLAGTERPRQAIVHQGVPGGSLALAYHRARCQEAFHLAQASWVTRPDIHT